ncbi:hypothetical protein CLU92_0991 [Janthinobacterium sp. 61]|uniref:hypothetical protein n=1 Tax=Janthinobacterium sp. 61 TaxID=2035209 RepID=UPI000C7014F7|nr:hypothetical protein [Janthinobacterium sp. 61]PKV43675.1 hypothetical protein CLU92_0991 [Janthinobacterium sp. 61]
MITKLMDGLPNQSMAQGPFDEAVAKYMADLPLRGAEENALLADVSTKQALASDAAVSATASASTAKASADAAVLASGVSEWVGGTTYARGVSAWSPVTFQTYRRKTAGAGALDPSLDPANWQALARQSTFTPVAVAALNIDLSLGSYFTKTVTASSTFTFSNVPAGGSSFLLKIRLDGGSIALPASVRPANGSIPPLTLGKTHRLMFESDDGGATWALVVAPNFAN